MKPDDFPSSADTPDISISQLAERVPIFKDDPDFTLPPLIPTVEDALVLPRQIDPTASEITPPDALQFIPPTSSI